MIELLVVVAIISILATVVLVNVTTYINRGKNAGIEGNLSTILTNASVYFDNNGNYTSFSTSTGYTNPAASAASANGGTALTFGLKSTNDAWCACSVMKVTAAEPAGSTYCVDSTGYKNITTTACATRCTNTTGACSD